VYKLLSIILIFSVGSAVGQQLNTSDEQFSISNLVFNEEFIAENGIKRIVATNSTKSDGQPLRQGKEYYYWKFDHKGRTIGHGKTLENTITNSADTLHLVMRYDKNDRLAYKTEHMGERLKSYHYKYNNEGKIIKTDIKEKTNYDNETGFITSVDSYEYRNISDSSIICNTFNENGASYREQMYTYDANQRILEKSGRYLRGNVRTKESYAYNEMGYLLEKFIYQDVQDEDYEKYSLIHDKIGNVHKIKTYRNTVNKNILDVIYFEDTILLKAIIDQDVETHDLNIIKFDYEYFELELLDN